MRESNATYFTKEQNLLRAEPKQIYYNVRGIAPKSRG